MVGRGRALGGLGHPQLRGERVRALGVRAQGDRQVLRPVRARAPGGGGRREVEVGYLFVRRFWGRGLATEAAGASRDWGFERLGRRRLVSLIDPRNTPSRRVAREADLRVLRRPSVKPVLGNERGPPPLSMHPGLVDPAAGFEGSVSCVYCRPISTHTPGDSWRGM